MIASAKYNLVTILGPTASGKTSFAAKLAYNIDGEIISADSRQVYRKMDIGTGKDYKDYVVNRYRIPVHLTDIVDPGYKYNIYEFKRDFIRAFKAIRAKERFPILCGGSGMYIEAATRNYHLNEVPVNHELRKELQSKSLKELTEILSDMKQLHNTTDTDTVDHALRAIEIAVHNQNFPVEQKDIPEIRPLYIGIIFDRQTERVRITKRLHSRLHQGMVEEVKKLLSSGISADSLSYYGLEYRYITDYLNGNLEYDNMVSMLNTAIHQFAKRQRTWFRKMEREGCQIHWFDGSKPAVEHIATIITLLEQ